MNSTEMMDMRMSLLDGKPPDICNACYYEDSNNKVSGRQRQLLKSAISIGNFDKSLCASPHYDLFNYSNAHDGHTNNLPVDLQIDLGSVCNSACIMCRPSYSTRLATDYEKLSKKNPNCLMHQNLAIIGRIPLNWLTNLPRSYWQPQI